MKTLKQYQLNSLRDFEKNLREHCRNIEMDYVTFKRSIKYGNSYLDMPFNPSTDHSLPTVNFITRKGRFIEVLIGGVSFGSLKLKEGIAKELYVISSEAYDAELRLFGTNLETISL